MSVQYAGADWVKSNWKVEMSPLGEAVADLLGDLFAGIYHLNPSSLKKVGWGNPHHIEFTCDQRLGTFDYDYLTRLVVLCHDRHIRCEIRGAGPGYLYMIFHQRAAEGSYYDRHPSIEENVSHIRSHYGYGPYQAMGVEAIAKERRRQREVEGWTLEHDDSHTDGSLAIAAACYAIAPYQADSDEGRLGRLAVWGADGMEGWPWPDEWDKRDQHDHKRCLAIAGALIAAEYDRIVREESRQAQANGAGA